MNPERIASLIRQHRLVMDALGKSDTAGPEAAREWLLAQTSGQRPEENVFSKPSRRARREQRRRAKR